MKRHKITFTDSGEPQVWYCNAYDCEHAETKFWESWESEGGAEGVRLLSVSRVRSTAQKIKALYAR